MEISEMVNDALREMKASAAQKAKEERAAKAKERAKARSEAKAKQSAAIIREATGVEVETAKTPGSGTPDGTGTADAEKEDGGTPINRIIANGKEIDLTPSEPAPAPKKKDAGPPRPYKTAAALKKKMKEYFDDCEEQGVFPDEAGMRIFLELGHRSYQSYAEDEDFELVFDWAQDMRESYAARQLAENPRAAQAFLNILKQSANGGWVDRKTDKDEKKLIIEAAGVGGMEAFK